MIDTWRELALVEDDSCAATAVWFRLVGDMLEPAIVTARLSLQPTIAYAKGTVEQVRQDEGENPMRLQPLPTGVWSLASSVVSTSLELHLGELLDQLEPLSQKVARLRKRFELSADFYCPWVARCEYGEPILSEGLVRRLGKFGAGLTIRLTDAGLADDDEPSDRS